jgi:hypothetical protein
MKKRDIKKLKSFAEALPDLLTGMDVPSVDVNSVPPGMNQTNRQADALAIAWKEVLAPIRKAYYDKVEKLLGESDDSKWIPIERLLEDQAANRLPGLKEKRQTILDHTKPVKDHNHWLEVQGDNGFGPNRNLAELIRLLISGLDHIARNETRDWRAQQGKNAYKVLVGLGVILGVIVATIGICHSLGWNVVRNTPTEPKHQIQSGPEALPQLVSSESDAKVTSISSSKDSDPNDPNSLQ